MGRLTKIGGWGIGIGGAAMTLALQVPPDQMSSNAALWVKSITGYLPDWPHQVDGWLTVAALAAMLCPVLVWAWRRRQRAMRSSDLNIVITKPDRMIPFIALREIAPEYDISFPQFGAEQNNAYYFEGALRQAAVDGCLAVKGRLYRGPVRSNDPLVSIPPEHFRDYEFRHGNLQYQTANELARTATIQMLSRGIDGLEGVTFYDLHISEQQARAVLAQFAQEHRA